MSAAEDRLLADRAARDAARAAVDQRLSGLRGALEQRSVKGRLVDEALARAQAGAEDAMAVANDSRWVLIATVVALGAWFARRPLGRNLRALTGAAQKEPRPRWPRWLERVIRKAKP